MQLKFTAYNKPKLDLVLEMGMKSHHSTVNEKTQKKTTALT